MQVDAVFSGGGVKGIALVGALSVFEEEGYEFIRHAGTSAGAIVSGSHAAGYTAEELKTEWMGLNLRRRLLGRKEVEEDRFHPTPGEPLEPLGKPDLLKVWGDLKARFVHRNGRKPVSPKRLGFFPTTGFGALFRELLEKKGVRTFKDLRLPGPPGERPRCRVQMVGADVTRGRLVLLPDDIIHYEGFESPDDLDVSLAMRISMSVPAFFQPVALTQKGTGRLCYLVDGGILSQFPIAYFDTHGPGERPTIGFRLERPEGIDHVLRVHGPVSMLMACALTALEAHDARLADSEDWRGRTVLISGQDVPDLNFLLSREQSERLYEGGVAAARAFLRNNESRACRAR